MCGIIYEIWKSGIKKTFSKNVPLNKTSTATLLKEIGEEGIYYLTTMTKNETNVLYHHFLTPVKVYNIDGTIIIRSVIKEYVDRNDLNNKFYYHQFEYVNYDNKNREISLSAALQSSENQDFENISRHNNINIE